MVLTYSNEPKLGESCPEFSLPSVDGKQYALKDFGNSSGLLVAFICKHCPYVVAIEDRLLALANRFDTKNLQVVAICSNDSYDYPEDSPESLCNHAKEKGYSFPYLVDESQEVAHAFGAVCTPDLFLYDSNRKLYYHGQLDDNWKDESAVESQDLKNAVSEMLSGNPPPEEQKPSMGCSIKWK